MTTTTTAIEQVQALYAAFGRGDVAYILAHIAPDCRWINDGEGIPAAGRYTGPAGAAEFFRKLNESETILRFEPREFFANGDSANGESVVALGYEECRANATGKTAVTDWAMLFRLRGGMVVHFQSFYNTAAYALAHRA